MVSDEYETKDNNWCDALQATDPCQNIRSAMERYEHKEFVWTMNKWMKELKLNNNEYGKIERQLSIPTEIMYTYFSSFICRLDCVRNSDDVQESE